MPQFRQTAEKRSLVGAEDVLPEVESHKLQKSNAEKHSKKKLKS
jgi:hypothetical protein